jgi:hypothetical protein
MLQPSTAATVIAATGAVLAVLGLVSAVMRCAPFGISTPRARRRRRYLELDDTMGDTVSSATTG